MRAKSGKCEVEAIGAGVWLKIGWLRALWCSKGPDLGPGAVGKAQPLV